MRLGGSIRFKGRELLDLPEHEMRDIRGRQIAMTSFVDPLPPTARLWIGRTIDLVGLIFCLYIAWFGAQLTGTVGATGQRSPTLGISAAWLYAALPVGFLLLAVRYGLSLFGAIDRRAPSNDASETHA